MISDPIKIDGVTYPHIHVMSIKRNFSVLDGEAAGRVMTGKMDRDVIGTFYNYSFQIDSDESDPDEYDDFYEVISAPVDSHALVVPYGQTALEFEAYITGGSDELEIMGDDENRWGSLEFNVIAMEPQRVPV